MSDNMTSLNPGENAMSVDQGANALAALRQKQQVSEEPGEKEEESAAAEPEAEAEVEEPDGQDEPQEADSESEPEEETEAEEESEEEPAATLTLPDGEKITAEEAVKGYLRHSDYTRKTQEVSRKKGELDAQHAEQMEKAKALYENLEMLQPKEPDWDKVAEVHGEAEALKAQRHWDKQQKLLGNARQEFQKHQKEQLARAQNAARERLLSGELIPEWRDTKQFNDGLSKVGEYLASHGYPEEALSMLADPVAITLAEKARRYDELQKVKPEAKKAVKAKPKPLKPGSKNNISTGKDRDKQVAIDRFRKTPTMEAGQAALKKLRESAGGTI